MNQSGFMPMTSLADKVCSDKSIFACSIPSEAISFRATTFPAWVVNAILKLRKPFSFTLVITKCLISVKVTSRSGNIFSTPRALPCFKVTSTLIGSAYFTLFSTFSRAILLITLACASSWLPTYRTYIRLAFTKACQLLALIRTIALRWFRFTPIKGMKLLPAIFTYLSNFHSHTYIISQLPVEEKYCEIAAKRCQQQVFKFEINSNFIASQQRRRLGLLGQ